jgi:hypothetical protein
VESLGNPALGRISYSGAQTSQRLKVPANNFPLPAIMIVSTGTTRAGLRRRFGSIQASN